MEEAIRKSEELARKMKTAAHHYDHADRVRKTVVELAREENLEEREVFLLEIAALWHDIGLDFVNDRSKHADMSAQMFLGTFEDDDVFSKEEKEVVTFLVKHHDKYKQASSTGKIIRMLRVLIDADALELLGERGYSRAIETAKDREWSVQVLIDQLNFQISCADLLFTPKAKIRGREGAKFLKDKINELSRGNI